MAPSIPRPQVSGPAVDATDVYRATSLRPEAFATDGLQWLAVTPLTAAMPQTRGGESGALDGSTLRWTGNDGNLYELPTTGGTPSIAVAGFSAEPFAVTADAYLYGFSTLGFQTMPR